MRDIIITLMVFGTIPFILMRPWYGVLAWSWLSYMNPHLQAWGFARTMPFAQIVALVLIVSLFINKDKRGIPLNLTTGVWLFFIAWMGLTTAFAIYPDNAMDYYERVLKIQLVTFFTFMLISDQQRVNWLIAVIVFSIGYFSFKGGIFTILSGGSFRVYGPGGMIGENNAFALATLMTVPLMFYLRTIATNIWVKRGLTALLFLSVISALGSQSRGALVTLIAVAGYYWWQSKSKVVIAVAVVAVFAMAFTFMPQTWKDRMHSTTEFTEDDSSMSRIHAWQYSINMANDRVLGGGFNSWSKDTYAIYRPDAIGVFVAHSIYFNVLADHGWLGLFLFLLVLLLTWLNLNKSIGLARTKNNREIEILASMIKVSMVAYMSGGAFLSLSYFDLPWHLMAVAVIIRNLIENQSAEGDGANDGSNDEKDRDCQKDAPDRRMTYDGNELLPAKYYR